MAWIRFASVFTLLTKSKALTIWLLYSPIGDIYLVLVTYGTGLSTHAETYARAFNIRVMGRPCTDTRAVKGQVGAQPQRCPPAEVAPLLLPAPPLCRLDRAGLEPATHAPALKPRSYGRSYCCHSFRRIYNNINTISIENLNSSYFVYFEK